MTLLREKSHRIQLCFGNALVYKYLQVAEEFGHTKASILGLHAPAPVADRPKRASQTDPIREKLLGRLITLLPGRALAFEAGLTLQPEAFGNLGLAVASSPTLGDALMQCQRFWHIYGYGLSLSMVIVEGQCHISVDALPNIDRRVRRCAIECILAGIHQCVVKSVGKRIDAEILFDGSEPIYANELRNHLKTVRYGAERCEYRFPSIFLAQPSKCSKPAEYRKAVDACLAAESDLQARESTVSYFVTKQLNLSKGKYPTFAKIAEKAAMSERTLRRRLREEGMPFSQLLAAARYEDARSLLEREELDIGEIAALLGYRERANFTRAFCRWHGINPRLYREALRPAEMAPNWSARR